jgi:hypothetical protein
MEVRRQSGIYRLSLTCHSHRPSTIEANCAFGQLLDCPRIEWRWDGLRLLQPNPGQDAAGCIVSGQHRSRPDKHHGLLRGRRGLRKCVLVERSSIHHVQSRTGLCIPSRDAPRLSLVAPNTLAKRRRAVAKHRSFKAAVLRVLIPETLVGHHSRCRSD